MLGFKSLCLAAAAALIAIPVGTAFAGGCGSSSRSVSVHVDGGRRDYGHVYRAPINYGHSDRHVDVVERHYDRHQGHIDRHTVTRVESIQHGGHGYVDRGHGYSSPRGYYRSRSRSGCR